MVLQTDLHQFYILLISSSVYFLSILVIGSDGQSIADSIYHDQYGDESTLYYDGGQILVKCNTAKCTEKGSVISLHDPQDKTIDIDKCNVTQEFVQFQLPVNDQTQLGEYKCKTNGKEVTQTFPLMYRMCSDYQDQCLKSEDKVCVMGEEFKDPKFCVITHQHQQQDTPLCRPGTVIDKTGCMDTRNDHFCPTKVRSLCEAIQTEKYSDTWAQYGEECEEKDSTVYFKLGEHVLRFDQTFALPHRPNEQLQLVCPSKSVFSNPDSVSCTVKDKERPIELNITVACNTPIQFPQFGPDSGLGNYKLRCKLVKGTKWAQLSSFIVVVEAAMQPMTHDGFHHCHQIGERPKNFLLHRKYFTDKNGKEFEEKEATSNVTMAKCHAPFVVKTCALQQRFERTVQTEFGKNRTIVTRPRYDSTFPLILTTTTRHDRSTTSGDATAPAQVDPGTSTTTSASRFKPEVTCLMITFAITFLVSDWSTEAVLDG